MSTPRPYCECHKLFYENCHTFKAGLCITIGGLSNHLDLAEGVAAPLEPTQPDLETMIRLEWKATDMGGSYIEKLSLADCRIIDERVVSFAVRMAAAVSKNLTDKYAEMEAKWMRELLTVSEEIGTARAELAKCGKENCFGQAVDGCRRWVSEERLNLEKQKVAELEKEITALRETKL